jgi:hypothetical protein
MSMTGQRLRIQREQRTNEASFTAGLPRLAGLAQLSEEERSSPLAVNRMSAGYGPTAGHQLGSFSLLPPGEYTVSEPGDAGEHAADRLAAQVLARAPREPDLGGTVEASTPAAAVQRQVASADASTSAATAGPIGARPAAHAVLPSGGRPLDDSVRQTFEPRFGYDLSRVRVFADSQAATAADALDAKAFTVGSDIVFGAGQYAPESESGQRVLAHELAHVVQGGSDVRTLHRWKDDGHIKTTREAAMQVFPDEDPMFTKINMTQPAFVNALAQASINMDKVVPHLADRFNPAAKEGPKFWEFTGTLLSSGAKDLLPGNQRKGMTRRGIKGEGPDHGEAGYYDVPKAQAIGGNVAQTNKYITEAVNALQAGNYPQMIAKLGDACHVAADRGSHAEGGQGEGHDTRMPDPEKGESGTNLAAGYMEGWADNDKMDLNPDGYFLGVAYTMLALGDFRNLARPYATNPF